MRETLQGSELVKDLEGDANMTASEIGTEDMELNDILKREGMDLNTVVEQWKQKGVEHIPKEEIDRVNFLFLTRQDAELKGLKRGFGATKGLGIKAQVLNQANHNVRHRKKRGRRTNDEALHELGQLLLNSGKMKTLEAFTFSS